VIIRSDFHLHSCVSPCGDLLMSPAVIVKTLQEKHIQLAALTDHNTALNCPAFAKCCRDAGIAALYGMEAQTSEELHVLCLFPVLRTAIDFCAAWYDSLPDIRNKPEITGDQVYVDENDEIVGEVEKYLITSAPWTLDECAAMVHQAGGLVIPAHVDRPAFSMMSQLGTIVEGGWDALEFVRPQVLKEQRERARDSAAASEGRTEKTLQELQNERQAVSALEIKLPAPYPVITSSDAHYVEHIGRRAFDLDIGDMPLVNCDGMVNLPAVLSGLAKRVVQP
jgi:3',5'-nucleoside bisphosphate phosphatase